MSRSWAAVPWAGPCPPSLPFELEAPPPAARQVGTDAAKNAAAKLADLKRLGQT